ncbi:Neuropeptide Y receptor type 2 [Collichthys lucidus]|uniref:Neuropeptide Y receptor type 2 n=1 Tax=Collichthys lucidus TaxID=240159 RepID=A0A4U5W0E3_COLLU|nr:Neuropeptide Y receptor type 2 [Collichthys lucidus]
MENQSADGSESRSTEPAIFQVCTEKWPGKSTDGTIYSISMLILQYFLPLSIISFAYARIWSKLRGHVSPAENIGSSSAGSERHRRRRKTTKMLVTMVVVFAVSWLPFHAFQLATDIDNTVLDMRDYRLLYTVFHVIAMCSTFANPLLYGWMNRNYRAAFLAVFKCRRGDNRKENEIPHRVGNEGKIKTREKIETMKRGSRLKCFWKPKIEVEAWTSGDYNKKNDETAEEKKSH